MSYTKFNVAFWHPFGPHGGETPEEIIKRKQKEIEFCGWTLWSFQYRKEEMLKKWKHELAVANPNEVFVFCSEGRGASDPASGGAQPIEFSRYRLIGEENAEWRSIPAIIRVPHPIRSGKIKPPSAFVVQRVVYPDESFQPPNVEWFSKEGTWRQTNVPPHGESLIRPGGTSAMRKIRLILELKPPYLAVLATDEMTETASIA